MKTALKLFFVLILSASILSVTSCIINDDYEMMKIMRLMIITTIFQRGTLNPALIELQN